VQRLRDLRDAVMPPDVAIDAATADLIDSHLVDQVVSVGAAAPPFRLPDPDGKEVALDELLSRGPVVLAFYRGQWCPFCCMHTRACSSTCRSSPTWVPPWSPCPVGGPDNTLSTIEHNGVGYPVPSDVGLAVARSYGLVFELPGYLQGLYTRLGHPVPRFNGTAEHALPIPGTFVIDTTATVRFAYADPNYMFRSDPADVLAALRAWRADGLGTGAVGGGADGAARCRSARGRPC
jgi:peroxiredoxin